MDYAMASTSLSHTYGNMTSFITEYVKGLFPKNYFQTVHISSTVAYRQFSIYQAKNMNFIKKNKPMLIIRPRVEFDTNDTFMDGTFLTQRITDNYMDIDHSNLQPFLKDPKNGFFMKYLLNRMKLYFDVTTIFESPNEQIDMFGYFRNRVRQGHPFFLKTCLESNIPRELVDVLAKDAKLPIYDEKNSVRNFLDYMNSISYYPITYKMRNATGKDEFFRYYGVNIDTCFNNLSIDEGSKKGVINDSFSMSFTVSTEFNLAGLYFYFTETPSILDIDMSIITSTKDIVPLFTITNLYDNDLPEGWQIYAAPIYKVDYTGEPDVMDFSSMIKENMRDIIKYHKDRGIPLSTFLDIKVLKDNTKLDPRNKEFTIDFDKFILTTNKTDELSTYRLVIYFNSLYINSLVGEIYGIDEEK